MSFHVLQQEISNAKKVEIILDNGLDSKSDFASKVFEVVFRSFPANPVHRYNSEGYMEYFWNKSFAVTSIKSLNQERNNFASFVRRSVDLLLPTSPKGDPDRGAVFDAIRIANAPLTTVDTRTFPAPSVALSYFVAASEVYSSAFFGRRDSDAWLRYFLPIVAAVSKYRSGKDPNSAKTTTEFRNRIEVINVELAGKTVSDVISTVEEALVRLFIIKYVLSSIFKDQLEILELLLKQRSAIAGLTNDCIAPVTLNNNRSNYTSLDIAFYNKMSNAINANERLIDKKKYDNGLPSLAFVAPQCLTAAASFSKTSKRRKITSGPRNTDGVVPL
jgi:hypothetical protein